VDEFDERYFGGISEADPAAVGPPPGTAVAPERPFALRGCVITPDERIDDGYVEVAGDRITSVGDRPPASSIVVLDTDGVILPGLIDLHGHPEFNVFAPWEPPRLFENRGQWRASPEYRSVVREPWNRLTAEIDGVSLLPTLTRYAEARSLVGGVTAIQGASAKYPDPDESLVRNVDRRIFGRHRARSAIDFDREDDATRALRREQIASGEVTAYYVHLAEGIDERSRREFDDIAGADLVTPATVLVHGTALGEAELRAVREAGASLVWSPQSNLRLYGRTTAAARALELGIPMALGADWQPSGSPSLLAELGVAQRQLAVQGRPTPPRELVAMVTSTAARIAGLEDRIGRLRPGLAADIVVLERHHEDPWLNVVDASPAWVRLVVIGGDLAYGHGPWIEALAGPADLETAQAWGRPVSLDTRYSVRRSATPAPRLAEVRAALLARDLRVGPIFA